jgi:hypothetical protein
MAVVYVREVLVFVAEHEVAMTCSVEHLDSPEKVVRIAPVHGVDVLDLGVGARVVAGGHDYDHDHDHDHDPDE